MREAPATERRRRKLMLLAKNEIGLTDEERIDLAQMLLRRDVRSYTELDDEQRSRLLDACEGYILIDELKRQRPPSDVAAAEDEQHQGDDGEDDEDRVEHA